MNILPARRQDGRIEAAEGSVRIALPKVPETMSDIGLRPEDLRVRPWDASAEGRPARVFEVEPLGGFTVVTLEAGQTRLRALVRGQPDIRVDSQVALGCDPARVQFFGSSGQTLARS
jgi:multiple sugar transport system ATP-binding protein